MARHPRQTIPNKLVEITQKTYQARFFFKPSPVNNERIVGILARAQQKYGMTVCGVVALSNHLHLLLVPEKETQLARFNQFVESQISKKIGKLIDWPGGLFRSRYSDVPVTDEDAAQIGRLLYLLSHGPKESLCPRPQDWPGVNCAEAFASGSMRLKGKWTSEAELYEARRGWQRKRERRGNAHGSRKRRGHLGRRPKREHFTEELELVLSPLPCWAHLQGEELRRHYADLLELVKERHAEQISRVPADWKKQINRFAVCHRPASTKRAPKPLCHAATRETWLAFLEAKKLFFAAYAFAADLLREGHIIKALASFPSGSFPPRLPAVADTG